MRLEEKEKYLHSKLISEESTFIPRSKKSELLVGAPEDNGLPPLSLDFGLEADTETKGKLDTIEDEDELRDQSSYTKIDKLYEDLNPKKFTEKSQQRFKTYLPPETANQLIKGMQS